MRGASAEFHLISASVLSQILWGERRLLSFVRFPPRDLGGGKFAPQTPPRILLCCLFVCTENTDLL